MAVPDHLKVDKKKLSRDIRPWPIKLSNWFNNSGILFFPIVITSFIIFPQTSNYTELLLLIFLFFYWKRVKRLTSLPFKKPKSSKEIDPNQKHPATKKPMSSEGIGFFGVDMDTNKQIWFGNDDLRTHILIFGTTGSGKTEALLSLAANALTQSSGFIYVDGKGDSSLFMKVFSMVRYFLREDDFLIINYMTGGSFNPNKKTPEMMSNTMNPFSKGSASSLSELINSLLPGGKGGDDMWKGRAASFMTALIRVLVSLRDSNKILLDVDTIRNFFELSECEKLIKRKDIPESDLAGLKHYVLNLPGYNVEDDEQEFDVLQQHGFITMQFIEIFNMLSDEYGHIMKTQLGEVDFFDVVVNRRILVVLLPALEKSTQSLTNLGKIIVASVRAMMSSALGAQLEGLKSDVIDRKPTNSPSPFLTIFDEYGYYSTEGAAVMPAQARSLGFSMVFAGQDYQAFKKGSAEEAASIVANCAIKICMKLEDPTETFEIFQKSGGEDSVAGTSGFQVDQNSSMANIRDTGNISLNDVKRISVEKLRDQDAGEGHILFKDKVVPTKMFFANPKQLKEARLNSFLKVYPPSYEEVMEIKNGILNARKKYESIIKNPNEYQIGIKKALKNTGVSGEISTIFKALRITKKLNSVISSFFSLITYIEKIKIIDNKILEESRKGFEEFYKTQEKRNKKDESLLNINEEDENINNSSEEESNFNDDIKKTDFSEKVNNDNKLLGKLKQLINIKKNEIQNMIPINPFRKLNPNEEEIHKNIKKLEHDINNVLVNKGINENEELLSEEYAELTAQKTITDINAATSIDKKNLELNKRKERNESLIKDILDEINEKEDD